MTKITPYHVKKVFVTADTLSSKADRRKRLGNISKEDFEKKLRASIKKVSKYSEKKLDRIISDEYEKRLKAYDSVTWSLETISTKELGVWNRAGGLPKSWTDCSLDMTAKFVSKAIAEKSKKLKKRARVSIPNIVKTVSDTIQGEEYLLPIVFESGIGTNGRRKSSYKTKYDIDDGCMRSISLAIAGKEKIKVYVGRKMTK